MLLINPYTTQIYARKQKEDENDVLYVQYGCDWKVLHSVVLRNWTLPLIELILISYENEPEVVFLDNVHSIYDIWRYLHLWCNQTYYNLFYEKLAINGNKIELKRPPVRYTNLIYPNLMVETVFQPVNCGLAKLINYKCKFACLSIIFRLD